MRSTDRRPAPLLVLALVLLGVSMVGAVARLAADSSSPRAADSSSPRHPRERGDPVGDVGRGAAIANPGAAGVASDGSGRPDEGMLERYALHAREAVDSGYPITSQAILRNCSGCHRPDDQGRLGRISYLRKTPEGWQSAIRRMVALHGVQLDPADAREIVRYLANEQGLAPEELRPARFEVERRITPYRYLADEDTEETCTSCHSMGRVITERRTADEWELLIATHRALYPLVDRQVFYSGSNDDEEDEPRGHPVERAIEHLAEAFPLETPEWSAWSANVRPARLEGTWAVSGHAPGRGPVYGTMEVRAGAAEDEVTTSLRLVYPEEGVTETRAGQGLVYTGYQWRGRSSAAGTPDVREVMLVERGWREMTGRWFHGAADELGADVTLRRVGAEPVIAGVHPRILPAGGGAAEVRVYGANLPGTLAARDLDLGPGVRVAEVVSRAPDMAVLRVEVEQGATPGARDLYIGGVTLPEAVVVYDRVDAIRIRPDNGIARVGGAVVPAQLQQFEAVAYANGVDGEAGTDDDLEIGVVPVSWSIDEYPVTYDDDDVRFVGAIDQRGLFTPGLDGPNPERTNNRNNMGEVWVVATYTDPRDPSARRIQARSYLIVTAPIHLRWDEWPTQ